MTMRPVQVTYLNLELLRPSGGNPRTHSRRQKEQLARAIQRFGFTVPVVVDEEGAILAGHARVEVARMLDMVEVPTIQLADMSQADKRAYVIADNKLAENAGWDPLARTSGPDAGLAAPSGARRRHGDERAARHATAGPIARACRLATRRPAIPRVEGRAP